jgi:putative hemolysin
MITDLFIVVALIALNGVLAMSELAVLSARPARLKALAGKSRGASVALRLAENPGRLLSTAQIGITLVGVLSGAFSGATLGARLADWLLTQGVAADWAATFGVGGVVVVLTYVSLVVGELVPKQIALRNAEAIAIWVAPILAGLSLLAAPLVWLLDGSSRVLLWLLGQGGAQDNRVTEEEVHSLLTEAHAGGVLEDGEREMMAGVMRLGDRATRALMTPRHEITMLDLEASSAEAVAAIRKIARPRMPVQSRETGEVVGIVTLADAFQAVSRREAVDLRALLRDVPVVSELSDALDVLAILQKSRDHLALVYDEYGTFQGIITTDDVLEAITGAVRSSELDEPALVERGDGSLIVSGWMPADELCDRLALSRDLAGEYDTVAGLVLHQLGRIPALGDAVQAEGYRFEVVDLDGMRIDKVLVAKA